MATSRWFRSLFLVGLLGFACANAQDVADLAGVRPGETLRTVAEDRSAAQSPTPFIWFGVPTRLPALAQIFPSGEIYVLRDGTVVGVRWERAYSTAQECASVAESVHKLLRPYFPGDVTGKDAWRYQYLSPDGARGVGVSCRVNEGGYHNVMVELVHFGSDKRLTELLGAR